MRAVFGRRWLGLGCFGGVALAACGGATLSALDIPSDAATGIPEPRHVDAGNKDGGKGKKDGTTHDAGSESGSVDVIVFADAPIGVFDGPIGVDVGGPDACCGGDVVVPPPDAHEEPDGANKPDAPKADGGAHPDGGEKPDATAKPDAGSDSGEKHDTGVDAASSCPATAPASFGACTIPSQICVYPTEDCTCGNDKFWSCSTCPATAPANGSTCSGPVIGMDVCYFGSTECACSGGKWSCGECPATQPAAMATCPVNGLTCAYPGASCTCSQNILQPLEWGCTATCPTMQPSPGEACDLGAGMSCKYGTTTCDCVDNQYFCN
jgi:hypothetical protein